MKLLKQPIKVVILQLFRFFGYAIIKLPPPPKKTSKTTTLILGGKPIKIHKGNPLCYHYRQNPSQNSLIGTMAALIKRQFPTAWAVDVGANVGDTLAIIKSQASLPVICVEGDSTCYALLQENARHFKDVYLFQTFLTNKLGAANMHFEKDGWNLTLSQASPGTSGHRIDFETLDHLVAGINRDIVVKLLKVDTEGHDMRIIRGGAGILKRDKPIIAFELNRENIEVLGDSFGEFFDFLVDLGYRNFVLHDSGGRLICALNHTDKSQFLDLYHYSFRNRPIYYFDVWAFHAVDGELFKNFILSERSKLMSNQELSA